MSMEAEHQHELELQEQQEMIEAIQHRLDEIAQWPGGMALLDDLRMHIFALQSDHDTENQQ